MDLDSAKKYVWVICAIGFAFPLFFVATGQLDDPTAKAAVDAIRENTGGGNAASSEQVRYPLAAGWTIDDPFTDQTRYWPEYGLLSYATGLPGSHRVLLRSPIPMRTQIFLIVGPADAVLPEFLSKLEEREKHPLRSRWEPLELVTADGVRLKLTAHGIGEGILAGEAIEQVSGFAKQGDVALLIDAGGAAHSFDRGLVSRILRQLEAEPIIAKAR